MSGSRCLIVVCILLFAAAAEGQSGAERERASAHFRRGVELYNDAAFRAALVEFERAYALAPDYRLLYNMGQVKFELQDFIGAAQAYEGYLAQGGSAVPPERRDEVEGELRSLRQRVGQISVTVNRDGAEVHVDDTEVGKTPLKSTILVNVGRHRITVRAPDGATASRVVDVAGNELAEVSLELAAPKPEVPLALAPKPGMSVQRKLAIAGWTAGGAILLGSVVTGVLAMSADDDLDTLFKQANPDANEVSDQRHKVKTLITTTNILIVTGAVVAATGTALWLFGPREDKKSERSAKMRHPVHVGVGLGSLSLSGRF